MLLRILPRKQLNLKNIHFRLASNTKNVGEVETQNMDDNISSKASKSDIANPNKANNADSKVQKMTVDEHKVWKHENENRGLGPGNYFVPTEMEKIKLVVGGAYRSLSEVPDVVRPTVYERARDYYLIYLNLSVMAFCVSLTLFGHYLVMKDRAFAEKYGINMHEDDTRRRHRHNEERKLREKMRKELVVKTEG